MVESCEHFIYVICLVSLRIFIYRYLITYTNKCRVSNKFQKSNKSEYITCHLYEVVDSIPTPKYLIFACPRSGNEVS